MKALKTGRQFGCLIVIISPYGSSDRVFNV